MHKKFGENISALSIFDIHIDICLSFVIDFAAFYGIYISW